MRTTRHLNLVVLHDLEDVRAAVEEALAHADAAEAPGLRKALSLIEAAARSDEDLKIRWARQTLDRAGVAAGDTSTRTIRELRRAAPQLGLAEAVELVTLAAKH
ncbi:hypothetical protein [Streptomyces sp. MK5]|uniref:hypothetical protein n=1 Tax=Streptomyces sp. MK5 TaxID=3064253 RepID=UPI002741AD03|nr:hypothetical protein [Streptomyces sp. MK5]